MPSLFAEMARLPSGWVEKVRIHWEQSRISAIETQAERCPGERTAPVVLPGMPNLHSHAFQRAMAGLTEYRANQDDDFWSWRNAMYAFAEGVNETSLFAIARQLYSEMALAGYTSVVEFHYLHFLGEAREGSSPKATAEILLQAAREVGIGITLCPVLYLSSGFGNQPLGSAQERFHLSVNAYCEHLRSLEKSLTAGQRLGIAFHSLRAVPPEAMRDVLQFRQAWNPSCPIHIHIAEQVAEVEACKAWSGTTPVNWLLENFPVDRHWCLVHATHMTQPETLALAGSGAVAGLCPTTEANLGDGFFPMEAYVSAGGIWGIGSDSHISISPVEELRWLEYGCRLQRRRRNLLCGTQSHVGENLWLSGLQGGLRAQGGGEKFLEIGALADWVVLDCQHPILAGRSGEFLLDAWAFSGNRPVVKDVVSMGEWVVENGRAKNEATIAESFALVQAAMFRSLRSRQA